MKIQTESKQMIEASKTAIEIENPMQEPPSATVDERNVLTAEAVFAARRLEDCAEQGRSAQKETGHTSTILFVP